MSLPLTQGKGGPDGNAGMSCRLLGSGGTGGRGSALRGGSSSWGRGRDRRGPSSAPSSGDSEGRYTHEADERCEEASSRVTHGGSSLLIRPRAEGAPGRGPLARPGREPLAGTRGPSSGATSCRGAAVASAATGSGRSLSRLRW